MGDPGTSSPFTEPLFPHLGLPSTWYRSLGPSIKWEVGWFTEQHFNRPTPISGVWGSAQIQSLRYIVDPLSMLTLVPGLRNGDSDLWHNLSASSPKATLPLLSKLFSAGSAYREGSTTLLGGCNMLMVGQWLLGDGIRGISQDLSSFYP